MTGISRGFQFSNGVSASEVVIFRQQSNEDATHRDAIEFNNGIIVPLQELEVGQRMGVIGLSAEVSEMRREALNSIVVA
jgi:hypothetical protein